jgi:hypothetical protein
MTRASDEKSFRDNKFYQMFQTLPEEFVDTEHEELFEPLGSVSSCCEEIAKTRLHERSKVASHKAYFLGHRATRDSVIDEAVVNALTAAFFNGCTAGEFEAELRDMLHSSWRSGRANHLRNNKRGRK